MLLLDTNALLWVLQDNPPLSSQTHDLISDGCWWARWQIANSSGGVARAVASLSDVLVHHGPQPGTAAPPHPFSGQR